MKPKYQRYYVKYLIKRPTIFYSFLLLGVVGFIVSCLCIRLDIRESFPATYSNNQLIVQTAQTAEPEKVYLYQDKNETIESYIVSNCESKDGTLLLTLQNSPIYTNGERLTAEFTVDSENLFHRIFVKAGRA